MFNNDENIKNYFVYQYHFLDDLSAVLKPEEVYSWFGINNSKENKEKIKATVNQVKDLFLANGWEGDGDVSVIWVPPFIDIGFEEDTWGSYLWHVKQSNNGTSFIASPIPLRLKRLKEQNDHVSINDYRNMEAINIIQTNTDSFLEKIKSEKEDFEKEVEKLEKELDGISNRIFEKLLGYTQCDLISQFNEFLNGCYLTLLIEVLQEGNKSKIKLRKSSVKVDLSKHNYEDNKMSDDDSLNWMSINMFITDIWHSYMFEPFNEKYDRLTKSVDFKANQELQEFIFKHIIIRNCIQHHDWQLNATSLKTLGKEKIEIATNDRPLEILKWKLIKLTREEIIILFEKLELFAKHLNSHINKRVKSRYYRPKK